MSAANRIVLENPSDVPAQVRDAGLQAIAQLERAVLAAFDTAEDEPIPFDEQRIDQLLELLGLLDLKSRFDFGEFSDVRQFCGRVRELIAGNPLLVTLGARWIALPDDERADAYPAGPERDEALRQAVHYCLVLHTITRTMAYDAAPDPNAAPGEERISRAVVERAKKAREATDWRRQLNLFERMKLASLDHGIEYELSFKFDPNWFTAMSELRGFVLQINILEAMYQDVLQGCDDNARAGYELCAEPSGRPPIAGLGNTLHAPFEPALPAVIPNRHPPISLAWDYLYHSWNLAFCSMYRNNIDFYCKLLAPIVAGCCPENPGTYMHLRAIALYLHATYEIATRTRRGSPTPPCDWRHPALTRLWGQLNREAALEYQRQVRTRLAANNGLWERALYRLKRILYASSWYPLSWLLRIVRGVRRWFRKDP